MIRINIQSRHPHFNSSRLMLLFQIERKEVKIIKNLEMKLKKGSLK